MDLMALDVDVVEVVLTPNWAFAPLAADVADWLTEDHGADARGRRRPEAIIIITETSISGRGDHDASTMWRELGTSLLDVLYPPVCAGCDISLRHGRSLCDACDTNLPRLDAPFCQCCAEAFDGRVDTAATCPRCLEEEPTYDFARPVLRRSDQGLELIHRFKYLREIHLAGELGRIAAEAFTDPRLIEARRDGWPIVPVPLHRSRQRQRHFNQASEIARILSRQLQLPTVPALKRIRATGSQTKLTREQRRKNLKGAFALTRRGRRWLEEKAELGVVLVDDVLTTGATVEECARVLRKAGFEQVIVVAVMRG